MTLDAQGAGDRTGGVELDDVPLAVADAERVQVEALGLQDRRRRVRIEAAGKEDDDRLAKCAV